MAAGTRYRSTEGLVPLIQELRKLDQKLANKTLKAAGKKASQLIETSLKRNTPKAKKKNKQYRGSPHLRDTMRTRSRSYNRGRAIVFLIGPESGKSPHAHLVERGTRRRFTGHSTVYQKTRTGNKVFRRVAFTTKTGKQRTKRILVDESKKKSTGSFRDPNKGGVRNRGIMPAFRMVERTNRETRQGVLRIIRKDIEAAIRNYQSGSNGNH